MIKKLKALILIGGFVGPVADLIRAIGAVRDDAPGIFEWFIKRAKERLRKFFDEIHADIDEEIKEKPSLQALKTAIEKLEEKINQAGKTADRAQISGLLLLLLLPVAWSLHPVACFAQTLPPSQFALELGGAMYVSSAPHSAAYLTGLLPIDAASKTRLYGTVQMRPVALNQVTYSTRAGVERELYADQRVSLNVFGQGGVATGPNATAGIFAGGGNVIITIKKGFALAIAVEALASPVIGGWEPQGRLGLRYTFGQ